VLKLILGGSKNRAVFSNITKCTTRKGLVFTYMFAALYSSVKRKKELI